jgi:hypothetical protein
MPDAGFAEALLSLVTAPERAAAAVGDLLEDVPRRGRKWFWLSVIRAVAATVWRDMLSTPFSIAAAAVAGWLGFMLVALLFDLVSQVGLRLIWAIGYVLAHHTGLELIVDALRVRIDWAPMPPALTHNVQWIAVAMWAPFYTGRLVARQWRRRALAFTAIQTIVWGLLIGVVPFVSLFGSRVTVAALPILESFLLIGVIRERWSQVLAEANNHPRGG